MDDDYDQTNYLWPYSPSPLFVPQSPSTPPHYQFPHLQMQQPTRRNPPPQRRVAQPKLENTDFDSPNSSFASGSASSSNSSTPQSSFGMRPHNALYNPRSKRVARHSKSPTRGVLALVGEGEASTRQRKRRRTDAEHTQLQAVNDAETESDWENMYLNTAVTQENQTEVIDLTEDSTAGLHTAREVQAARGLESLARTQRSSRIGDLLNYSLSTREDLPGSRAEPILIDLEDSPPRVATHVSLQPHQSRREESVEILQSVVARQQQEAVAAQSKTSADKPTTFSNMNCVICMDAPRNLSMVPCGHVFCGACITEALKHSESRIQEHSGPRKAQCPVCRNNVQRQKKGHLVPILLKKGVSKGKGRQP